MTRRGLVKRLVGISAALVLVVVGLWFVSIRMPGTSWAGALPPLSPELDTLSKRLRGHVDMLAGRIGERNSEKMRALDSAADYMSASLKTLGLAVTEQRFDVNGRTFRNIEVTLAGSSRANEIIVVGGHYDSAPGTPGADDNASGAAAILEMARLLKSEPHLRTIKIVAFANEEPPFFFTEDMGSRRYARAAKERGDNIVAMISMETIGYYSDADGSQKYPPILGWFYPSRGDFIGIVGNVKSRALVHRVVRDFRQFAAFPSAGSAAPMQIPGISWSDQWSFWKEGYVAVMITDTAPFRNPNYHEMSDRPESLNYDYMARVVQGVARVVAVMATTPDW
jgi:Zn-dependent M28 family amino/carboxypeptidase